MQEQLEQWLDSKIEEIEALMDGECMKPQMLLGSHIVGEGQILTAYRPNAWMVKAINKKTKEEIALERLEETDFFACYIKEPWEKYCFAAQFGEDCIITIEDPYSFEQVIGDLDIYLYGEGNHYEIYEKFGAHPMTIDGVDGTYFAVWAPHAQSVHVMGTFNLWDELVHPMKKICDAGIYELFIPGVQVGDIYKYQILTKTGEKLMKADPYASCSEFRPNNASVVADLRWFEWTDEEWIKNRSQIKRVDWQKKPVSIYEVHLGSWRKHQDWTEDGFYNYREIAHELADYMIEMGYTHVELMGIAEHPFDGSWGYQVTGYFAPTRRYGNPEDFMYFINYMHSRGLFVILDWVPAHFPRDAHGLAKFDGMPLYEHPDKRRGEHPHWGTLIFNYEKKEIENFLIANALYWVEKFHVDGLRVDAVASILYLNYGKEDGEWLPNKNGGMENLDAIELFMHLNKIWEERVPGAMMIAEESTSWAGVTAPVSLNGLGFLFKWNMGWMNDFLEYMKLDPYFRKFNHNKLTFSMHYAYSENFIQVLSHDEVVHGKCSMINKMPGYQDDKFANLRTAYGFMYAHPGKKLLFMGQEFAQYNEWSEAKSLDWDLLGEERNYQMQQYVKRLNALYKEYNSFYYNDYDPIGFEWMTCDDNEHSIVAFVRRGNSTQKQLLCVYNFTPVLRGNYRIGVPCKGEYKEILNSDSTEYGGKGLINHRPLIAEEEEWKEKDYSIVVAVPPLSCMIFEYDYVEGKPVKKEKSETKQVEKSERKRTIMIPQSLKEKLDKINKF